MKKRKHIVGDDLDDHYLRGEPNYESIFVSCLIAVLFVVAIWPKKG